VSSNKYIYIYKLHFCSKKLKIAYSKNLFNSIDINSISQRNHRHALNMVLEQKVMSSNIDSPIHPAPF
jgi:transcriptional regulator CtsR